MSAALGPLDPDPPPIGASAQPLKLVTTGPGDKIVLARAVSGIPHSNLDNACRVLESSHGDNLWLDQFSGAIKTDWAGDARKWTDADSIGMAIDLQRNHNLPKLSVETVHQAVSAVSSRHARNECQDWLRGLRWDGRDRLETALSQGVGCEDTEYSRAVSRCFFVSMVARVMRPGCKVDTMPVFEGDQGAGKSTALSVIGGDWYVECHESVLTKDFFGVLDGHMLVEISEMQSFSRAEVNRIKGIVSCLLDRYRSPYGRFTQDHPRQTVLAGTTNSTDWNRDETGARRFWPIRCDAIDLPWLRKTRAMLFAEAVHRYDAGQSWWDVPEALARAETDARYEGDPWEGPIADFVTGRDRIRIEIILRDCLKFEIAHQDQMVTKRVGRVLRTLGFERKNARAHAGGAPEKFWVRTL